MRDPERINEILNLIKSIWIYLPDLRLIQLLLNVLPRKGPWYTGDYFYMEDEELVKHLKNYLKNIKEHI